MDVYQRLRPHVILGQRRPAYEQEYAEDTANHAPGVRAKSHFPECPVAEQASEQRRKGGIDRIVPGDLALSVARR